MSHKIAPKMILEFSPEHFQYSKSFKIASKVILELRSYFGYRFLCFECLLHPLENVDLIAHRDVHSMEITIFLMHQENHAISLNFEGTSMFFHRICDPGGSVGSTGGGVSKFDIVQ